MIQGRKRYIFKVQDPKNENEVFTVYEWGDSRAEAQEKAQKQYFEKDVTYIGRKEFDDSILENAEIFMAKVETEPQNENSEVLSDFEN